MEITDEGAWAIWFIVLLIVGGVVGCTYDNKTYDGEELYKIPRWAKWMRVGLVFWILPVILRVFIKVLLG